MSVTFRSFRTMRPFQADRGLLVSWGGYTKSALQEARVHFFSIRLWDSQDIMEALFRTYDRLPEDLRADIPLKRIWTLVLDE
jgi:restriction system protein